MSSKIGAEQVFVFGVAQALGADLDDRGLDANASQLNEVAELIALKCH